MNKINYVGPYNPTGYGVASTNYALGILKNGVDINFKYIGPIAKEKEFSSRPFTDVLSKVRDIDDSLETFIFWHAHDLHNHIDISKPFHAFTTFEIDTLSSKDISNLQNSKTIGTTNKYHADILRDYFPDKKIYVAPHAFIQDNKDKVPTIVDEDPVSIWKNILSQEIPDSSLVISSAGKYEFRKGHPQSIEACIELSKTRPVLLLGFWHNPFIPANYPFHITHYLGFELIKSDSGIFLYKKDDMYLAFMPPSPSRQELHGAITRSHLFLAPSLAEGWNLVLFEMMSLGMICAATHVTAHKDYCDNLNSIEIETNDKIIANDPPFFNGSGKWFDVSSENIHLAMSKFLLLNSKEKDNIKRNARNLSSKYSWKQSAKMIIQNIT